MTISDIKRNFIKEQRRSRKFQEETRNLKKNEEELRRIKNTEVEMIMKIPKGELLEILNPGKE